MSKWFTDRRQEFIKATLKQFGQIRRADLVKEFGISTPQASIDIQTFLDHKPPHVVYDVRTKYYILTEEPEDNEEKSNG